MSSSQTPIYTYEEIALILKRDIIIRNLELKGIEPGDIADDAPLFGEGLGLESVEAFYIAGGIQERFGVKIDRTRLNQLRPHFVSVRTLGAFVMQLLAGGERHG